ncbi:MAG: hypothetical protein NE334_06970 [Lentisphaeraceae bacterium]|nr:hypothetical protein [Lentisphaeraceae bacterium]
MVSEKHKFLVVDDLEHMPLMSRLSISDLPIIFVTDAVVEDGQISEVLSAGAVDYVCKPFDTQILKLIAKNFVELTKKNLELKKEIETRLKSH